jgi:glycosyltransferase involved in cell wall biosynthesis
MSAKTSPPMRPATGPPDVTVVVPVYNTMPYLTRCMTSLVRQTIGLDRMEIIAVDDGSTDRSGRALDRYARRYPGVVTAIHQPNSGGPAGPCNRALDIATGRYVFFVGADDYLGREALRRLVTAADAYESDVVLGKVVGVHSRFIYQDIFARNEIDVGLFDSVLPRSLANTKLFRRDLLERHGIRYLEELRLGSDQPFTLEACYRARRISVLADYNFYFAVRRFGAGNISYVSRHVARLRALETMMSFTADLIPAGKQRDAVLARRFDHEVARLVEDDVLLLDRDAQQRVHDGVGRLAREYLTDDITAELGPEARIRITIARDASLDDLLAVIGQDARVGVPDTLTENSRRYARYPGFRDPARAVPDSCFDVTTSPEWAAKLDVTGATWERGHRDRLLRITAHTPVPDFATLGEHGLVASAEEIPGELRTASAGPSGTTVHIRFGASELLAASPVTGQRRIVSAQVGAFDAARALGVARANGAAGAAALRAPLLRRRPAIVRWRGARPYVITPSRDASGRFMISIVPLTLPRVVAQIRRRLRGDRQK